MKVIEVKNSLNCKVRYIDHIYVCDTFLISNNKNISKIKETQDKKLCNLLLINVSKNSNNNIKLYSIFQVITYMIVKNQSYIKV